MNNKKNIKNDLDIIKKKYGENMMHLCRKLFPSILEEEGLLSTLLLTHFMPCRFLYDDIVNNDKVADFKDYIYSVQNKKEITYLDVDKKPAELLDDAGYILYECKTEDEMNLFIKYYNKENRDEILCSFNSNRLDEAYVFFAVKKNVDSIKRDNFPYPRRQDEYGTSVISIQFKKGNINTLSIMNRYNHLVDKPDSTFSNNLDNIIPGLTISFVKEYKLNLVSSREDFQLAGYVKANDGRYYKYNYIINKNYYCIGNIIITKNKDVVTDYLEFEKYIVADCYVIDLVNKKISLYDKGARDSFVDEFTNIEKINVVKDKETDIKNIEVIYDGGKKALIVVDNTNKIIEYHNSNLTQVNSGFMWNNKVLRVLNIPNLEYAGNGFLRYNELLEELHLPKIIELGNVSLRQNRILRIIDAPNLERIGNEVFFYNNTITTLYLPKVKIVSNGFFKCNKVMKIVNMLSLEIAGSDLLEYNDSVEFVYLPSLKTNINNERIKQLLGYNVSVPYKK